MRITTDEFFSVCEPTGQAYIGNTTGLVKCKNLVLSLIKDFDIRLEHNPQQRNYSPTLWLKPISKRKDRITMNQEAFQTIVRMHPDDFSLESDGFFYLWWD